MGARRAFAVRVLEELAGALREMSDADFERVMRGELRAVISFVEAEGPVEPEADVETEPGVESQGPVEVPARRQGRRAVAAVSEEELRGVHERLAAAGSREDGQRIVEAAFADKEGLFGFAKYLDLPVQRTDSVAKIRDKVVTHTVGRRLSGRAVRGG